MGNPKPAASTVGANRKRQKTGGRVAGTPNKATQDVRQAVAAFAEENASNFAEWINTLAYGDGDQVKPDPGKAADLYLKAIEYHIPKLARMEHSGIDGKAIKFTVNQPWLQQQVQKRNS